jgi:hypothetical protein
VTLELPVRRLGKLPITPEVSCSAWVFGPGGVGPPSPILSP